MKRALVFLVAVTACLVSAEWDWDADDEIATTCAKKMNITLDEDGSDDLSREGPDSEQHWCYMRCVGRGQGLLAADQDEYVPEKGKDYMDAIFKEMKEDGDDTSYNETQIRSEVDTCIKNASGTAKCEKAWKILECIYDHFDMDSSSEEETTEASG